MPVRYIHVPALSSPSLMALSDFAERLWWRLVLSCDDLGRFEANPLVVRSRCFPLAPESVPAERVASALAEIDKVCGAVFYSRDGRNYGQIVNWAKYQKITHATSTFPGPDDPPPPPKRVTVAPVTMTQAGFSVPPETLARWAQSYPNVDVASEVKAAFEWMVAKPERRKIQFQAFLVRWLKRSQDKPGRVAPIKEGLEQRAQRMLAEQKEMRKERIVE